MYLLIWFLLALILAGLEVNESTYPTALLQSGVAYLQSSDVFVLGMEVQPSIFLHQFSTLSTVALLCGVTKSLLWMDYIRGTEYWVVGCSDRVQLRSESGLEDQFSLAGGLLSLSPSLSFSLAFPYLDIHSGSTVFSCRLDNFTLQCSQISREITGYSMLSTNGYNMWAKILISQTYSRIFIYHQYCVGLEIQEEIYAAVQVNYTLYVWTSGGLYSYDHEQRDGLMFVDWGQQPQNKGNSLGYVNNSLLFLNSDGHLMVHSLLSNVTQRYNQNSYGSIFQYDYGVVLFSSLMATRLQNIHPHTQQQLYLPSIPWNKIEEYQQLPIQFYQTITNTSMPNNTNTNTNNNNTNPNTNTNNNNTNNTTIIPPSVVANETEGEQREDRRSHGGLLVVESCGPDCMRCRKKRCVECEVGFYRLSNGSCKAQIHFQIFTTFASYPYSNIVMRMLMLQLMEELWFYEYQKYNYSQPVASMIKYIGNVNRNRYIPPYVKDILPDLHSDYLGNKSSWGFTNTSNFTTPLYMQHEKQPINFTLHASKMYLWNYILCFIIYTVQRVGYCLLSSCRCKKVLRRTTVGWLLVIVLVEGNVQYISFLFFQQVKQHSSVLVFQDKVNLVVAVLFMFVAFVYTVGSFAMFSYLLSRKKFRILFPTATKNTVLDMVVLIVLGPGRNMFLGFVQAFNENFTCQVLLLMCLNAVSLVLIGWLHQRYYTLYNLTMRYWFMVIIMIFLLCGLLNHHSLIFQNQTFHTLQLISMSGLVVMCILDCVFGFLHFILDAIFFLTGQCSSRHDKKIEGKIPEEKIAPPDTKKVRKQRCSKQYN